MIDVCARSRMGANHSPASRKSSDVAFDNSDPNLPPTFSREPGVAPLSAVHEVVVVAESLFEQSVNDRCGNRN